MKAIRPERHDSRLRVIVVAQSKREEEKLRENWDLGVNALNARVLDRVYKTVQGLGIRIEVPGVFPNKPVDHAAIQRAADKVAKDFKSKLKL